MQKRKNFNYRRNKQITDKSGQIPLFGVVVCLMFDLSIISEHDYYTMT